MERNALTYAGHTVWNRHAEKADGGGYIGGEKYRPESEWVIQKNTHEPLISDEESSAILLQIETRKVSRTKESKDVYLLAGILKSTDGATWHASGDGSYRLGKGKRVSANNVDSAVIQYIKQDITSDVFATAVLDHYKALSKPANKDKTLAKVISKIAELDTQAHKLAELLTKTTAQEALLRSIEKMESERNELQKQLIEYREAESNQKTFRDLKLSEVKTMLNTVADELGNENHMLLKDALGSIIDTVILNEASMQATVTYKINNVTGDKMASPRGEKASRYLAGLKTFKYKASSQSLSVETLSNSVTPTVTLSP